MADPSKLLRQIALIGKKMYAKGLITANSGNISCRLDKKHILITASGTNLSCLSSKDIVKVDIVSGKARNNAKPSSELPMHSMIHQHCSCAYVLHAHPQLTNAYFAIYDKLQEFIFETRFVLGNVPVVKQKSVNVTNPWPVIMALRKNKIVVLRNHGVVAVGDNSQEPFGLIETLEAAIKVAAVARLFARSPKDMLDKVLTGRI